MDQPVTLLVPNYNYGRYLQQTVPALLGQTYPHFRLIVVDNHSTDDSVAVVRRFDDPRLRLVAHDTHVSISANFDRAMDLVDSPFFATCAADEVYEPQWLEVMMALLASRADAFAACCKANTADAEGRIFLDWPERYKGTFWPPEEPCVMEPARCLPRLLKAAFLIWTTAVFRTEAFHRIGPINHRLGFSGDWEFWIRGLVAGFSIVGTHRPLVHYRRHANMTSKRGLANLERFRDELTIIEWGARAAYEHGWIPAPTPDYNLVRKTLLAEFIVRLSSSDREGARAVLTFGQENIPGFRNSASDRVMRMALLARRLGGLGLRACQNGYLCLADWLSRRPFRGWRWAG